LALGLSVRCSMPIVSCGVEFGGVDLVES
jgi:hypothetical protein